MAPLHSYGSVKVPACTHPGKVDAHALIMQVGGIWYRGKLQTDRLHRPGIDQSSGHGC